jgi:hypothetical protein
MGGQRDSGPGSKDREDDHGEEVESEGEEETGEEEGRSGQEEESREESGTEEEGQEACSEACPEACAEAQGTGEEARSGHAGARACACARSDPRPGAVLVAALGFRFQRRQQRLIAVCDTARRLVSTGAALSSQPSRIASALPAQ